MVKIEGRRFRVIGVLEEKGRMMGFDFDDLVIIPVTSASSLFRIDRLFEIGILSKSEDLVRKTKSEVTSLLLERYKEDRFRVHTQSEGLAIFNTIIDILTGVIGRIAAISLLVGGIGIMNIMLVSVTTRFHEIGIRKAIGAKNLDIFIQFLIESILIWAFGGSIGIAFGITGSILIMKAIGLPITISILAILLAGCVSLTTGVICGVYPAMKAARLNPIDTLRYE